MKNKLAFAMVGAAGRMGLAILRAAQSPDVQGLAFEPVAALESTSSRWINKKVADLLGASLGIASDLSFSSLKSEAFLAAKVAIDFSVPKSSMRALALCHEHGIAYVLGTTGFSGQQKKQIEVLSQDIPVLMASNMSLGVNLLFYLSQVAAQHLNTFDVEIVDLHHRYKRDAPSGTALTLKDSIKQEPPYKDFKDVYGRRGAHALRDSDELAVHTLRGGDVVGEHTVYFLGSGERLELTHRASSRDAFAQGALKAAAYLAGSERAPGLYSMRDVLGLAN